MNNKMMGILLIVFGGMLFVWGYNMYDASTLDVNSNIPPFRAWVGMIVGGINVFVGFLKLKQ
ncbi:DUF3185 family protein [Psychromonas aquatilis]|uniref:DUF3185 family protein n=1 Tax=Psychromonas aquatilis TaxID=2005072 RepID=A0ABU9GL07_9GAMM